MLPPAATHTPGHDTRPSRAAVSTLAASTFARLAATHTPGHDTRTSRAAGNALAAETFARLAADGIQDAPTRSPHLHILHLLAERKRITLALEHLELAADALDAYLAAQPLDTRRLLTAIPVNLPSARTECMQLPYPVCYIATDGTLRLSATPATAAWIAPWWAHLGAGYAAAIIAATAPADPSGQEEGTFPRALPPTQDIPLLITAIKDQLTAYGTLDDPAEDDTIVRRHLDPHPLRNPYTAH